MAKGDEAMKHDRSETYRAYTPKPFTADDKKQTTLVFGGLTWRAEKGLEAAFRGSGFRAQALPNATRADLIRGRELADVGQCCPTAFTTGSLANFLLDQGNEHEGKSDTLSDYAYVTAGSCGSCRFGQYHQSYELALRNLGMEDFRLYFLAQDPVGAQDGAGIELPPELIVKALTVCLAADAIQDVEYQIRPYEIEQGATNRAARRAVDELCEAIERARPPSGNWSLWLWALFSRDVIGALQCARRHFDEVAVDRLRVKPKVKITGEFYLQTVEGDPNYNIHAWLEQEGAEVYPAPVVIWLDYLLRCRWQYWEQRDYKSGARRRHLGFRLASRALTNRYDQMRRALGGLARGVPPQLELRSLAEPYYDSRLSGGEGDMLIGKAIWAHIHRKAHMIAELSPYACMPNTMSIGAMAAVQGDHPDMLYAALEVKGDSEVHALSRCQMILSEAKTRAEEEFDRALHASGLSVEDARDRLHAAPRPTVAASPYRGAAGTAANLVLDLAGAKL